MYMYTCVHVVNRYTCIIIYIIIITDCIMSTLYNYFMPDGFVVYPTEFSNTSMST